jgi:hypothetical protein
MTDPKKTATMRLLALVGMVLLVWSVTPAPRWAASIEIASFRLSLSGEGATVRLRTGVFDSGQSGFALLLGIDR